MVITKDLSQAACHCRRFLDEEEGKANYLDTLIYRLCFIARSWCIISSQLRGLSCATYGQDQFLENGLNDVAG